MIEQTLSMFKRYFTEEEKFDYKRNAYNYRRLLLNCYVELLFSVLFSLDAEN